MVPLAGRKPGPGLPPGYRAEPLRDLRSALADPVATVSGSPSTGNLAVRALGRASHESCHSSAFTMNGRRRRIQRCWHDEGAGGFSLVMTFHDSGQGPVYRIDADDGTQLAWAGTELDAKARADDCLREKGHQCSPRCTAWSAIPQPEPGCSNP